MGSLPNGDHNIDINSQGGTASGSFTVTDEVPSDSTIYEGGSLGMGAVDLSGATEINPEEFAGRSLTEGDVFEYGDYVYYYCGDSIASWRVFAKDKTKTEYGELLTKIAGEPVKSMAQCFVDCTALTTAPTIPDSVTSLWGTFMGCTNLTKAPVIPEGVTGLSYAFSGCTNLTTAPIIPSSVTMMYATFQNCTALTGSITINVISIDDIMMNDSYYGECFAGTTQPIVLTGSSTHLNTLASTATNGNVTVAQ
jgi:hypothetical protein